MAIEIEPLLQRKFKYVYVPLRAHTHPHEPTHASTTPELHIFNFRVAKASIFGLDCPYTFKNVQEPLKGLENPS